MDPDQTALGEQSALDLHCLFKRLHNISIDDKNIRLCCNTLYTFSPVHRMVVLFLLSAGGNL